MKFPITPLLYLVSLASLGGIAYSVYQFSKNLPVRNAEKMLPKIRKFNSDVLRSSKARVAGQDKRWQYDKQAFWKQFQEANFIGRVPKKKVEVSEKVPEVSKQESELVNVADVVEVIGITRGGEDTGIVVRYNQSVTVPEEEVVSASATPVTNTVPKGRRGRSIPRTVPVSTAASTPPDHIRIGEPLWAPFDYIFLKAVGKDADHAVFELRIESKKDKEKGYPTQSVMKGDLALPPEVVAALLKGEGDGPEKSTSSSSPKPPVAEGPAWVDTPETVVDRSTGRVNVARKDQQFLEKNARDIWTDDVHMRDYSGGSGSSRVRGVQLRKLSPRVRQFGMNEGDVVIELNGVPVTGMAHAKKVGRRLYNQGVRNFKATVLRQGREIERTYVFKK